MRFKKSAGTEKNLRRASATQTKANILDAARGCFLEKEYKKVTFREIAARANVTSGLIPYYFSNKERLAACVYEQLMDEIAEQLRDIEIDSISNAAKYYVVTYFSWICIDNVPEHARFYYAFCENMSGEYLGNGRIWGRLVDKICHEYGLTVSPAENELFQVALRGQARALVLQRYHNYRTITREEIMDLTTSNFFYNLGMSDEAIFQAIQSGKAFLMAHFPEKMDERNIYTKFS